MTRIKQRVTLPDGTKVWCTGNNLAEALQRLVDNHFIQQKPDNPTPIFKDYADKWYELYHKSRVGYKTSKNTASYLKNHIYPVVGHKHLDEVSHDDVQIIFDSMASRGQSTVHNVHIIMNQILGNAVEDGLLTRNIAHSNRYVKSKKVVTRQALTREAAMDILNNLDKLEERDRLFIALALHTGLRRGEIYALQWNKVDLDNRMIHVRNAVKLAGNIPVIGPPKSKAGIRDVPINDPLLDMLRRCSNKQGFVITGERNPNGAMSSCGMNRQWQRIKRKIDVHGATPHVFRHTFATLIQPHTDIKTLQTIMGHSDIETTLDRYTHFVHENVAALAQINPYCDKLVTHDTPQSQ